MNCVNGFRKVVCLVKAVDQFRCLVKSKLFQGLDDTALKEIFDAARLRHVAPKTNIIVNGGKPDHLFLLQKGRVRSHILTDSGSDVVLLWVVPGGGPWIGIVTRRPSNLYDNRHNS